MTPPTPPIEIPTRASQAHKGDFGKVLLVGGSRGMAGSISLSSIAALKSGSGLVSTAIPDTCLETVAGFHPGVMTIPMADDGRGQFSLDAILPATDRFDAIGCGPGMRTGPGSIRIVESILCQHRVPRVLDADAINVLSDQSMLQSPALPRDQTRLVLTPHPGELARLVDVPAHDRDGQINAAKALSTKFGMTIVVKGGPTVVVGCSPKRAPGDPDIAEYTNSTGNPGMATAGSGDVLTGVIASLLGQGFSSWDAARLGVYLHGLAGDDAARSTGQVGMTCLDILNSLPRAFSSLSYSSVDLS